LDILIKVVDKIERRMLKTKESQERQEIRVPAERGLFLNPMKAPLPSHDGNVVNVAVYLYVLHKLT
jgi:hypothetical protein